SITAIRSPRLTAGQHFGVKRIQQFVALERFCKSRQILDSRIPSPGRRSAIWQRVCVGSPCSGFHLCVPHAPVADSFVLWLRSSGGHARWHIDVLPHVVVITLPADLLDDRSQQNETVVAVLPARARLELRSAVAVEVHIILQRA